MRRVLPAVVLLFLWCAAACSSTAEQQQPDAAPALDDLRTILPAGWAIEDWRISSDGQYIALVTVGHARDKINPDTPAAAFRTINVYRWTEHGAIELARAALGPAIEPLLGGRRLDPEPDGTRPLRASFADTDEQFVVEIEEDGKLTVRTPFGPADQESTVTGIPPDDPLAETQPTPRTQVAAAIPSGVLPLGWVVAQAFASDDQRYLAITTVNKTNQWLTQLSMYEIGENRVQELWREVNFHVSAWPEFAFKDVNGDGASEVVYSTGTGGTGWTATPRLAVAVRDHHVEDIIFELPALRSAPGAPDDVDGDGIFEWIAVDASWELAGFCHACSPQSSYILAWDGEKYADATPRFAQYLNGLQDPDPVPPDAIVSCVEFDSWLFAAISRLLTYENAGQPAGAARMLEAIRGSTPPPQLARKKVQIVAALENASHYPESIDWGDCPYGDP